MQVISILNLIGKLPPRKVDSVYSCASSVNVMVSLLHYCY